MIGLGSHKKQMTIESFVKEDYIIHLKFVTKSVSNHEVHVLPLVFELQRLSMGRKNCRMITDLAL